MEKVIKFGDNEIQKQKLHQHKEPVSIKKIDVNKIVVSNSICLVFLAKKDLNILLAIKMIRKIRPLCIFLQKISAYRKDIVFCEKR